MPYVLTDCDDCLSANHVAENAVLKSAVLKSGVQANAPRHDLHVYDDHGDVHVADEVEQDPLMEFRELVGSRNRSRLVAL